MLGTSQTSIYRRLKKLKTEINILGK
ncbi:hypothetical protein AAAK71_17765 [Clostridioides difficile]